MELAELLSVIRNAGGGAGATEYADSLLIKLNQLESVGRYGAMLKQLRTARQFGDFRGRVLEVNFAAMFWKNGIPLTHEPRQGMAGDIDFRWDVGGYHVFIELKLLRQSDVLKSIIDNQLQRSGIYKISLGDDTPDIGRIQRDIIAKSTIRKFNPTPLEKWINLVAIDLCELQLGGADLGDCLLAAGGNPAASQHYYRESICRRNVVGVFEQAAAMMLSIDQMNWICKYQKLPDFTPHPREYIHGALFLFREPQDTAALSYDLSGFIVWNPLLVTREHVEPIVRELSRVVAFPKKESSG